jgi:Ni,Fe-hydrogenase III large subunit
VTLEEAHELVKAFQKDHGVGGYGLEKYEVNEYPGFQFFRAVPDPPRGRLHYAVDLKNGEVWDAVVCEKLTSPSLKKLQNAIRNRIGLTADEYRKIGRPGPFCEQ